MVESVAFKLRDRADRAGFTHRARRRNRCDTDGVHNCVGGRGLEFGEEQVARVGAWVPVWSVADGGRGAPEWVWVVWVSRSLAVSPREGGSPDRCREMHRTG